MVMPDINQKLSATVRFLLKQPKMANPNDGVPQKKPKMSHVSREELRKASRDDLVERVMQQQQEIDALKSRTHDPGLDGLMQTVEKLKQQVTDSSQQESKLMMRLTAKEQEIQELMTQIQEMKQAQNPSSSQLSAMLLDPAINLMFCHMKQEMDQLKSKLEQAQNDLAAWKFTPDSQTGKRLMAKCRMLLQENEELGKNVSSGRVAKLEGDIALQKALITEMKKSEAATEEFLAEMDDDMEAMQSTVFLLQQELKDAKERLQKYECAATSTITTTSAAPQSLDTQNGQSTSADRMATNVEDQKAEANLSSVDCNNGISETTTSAAAAVIHQGTGLEVATDGLKGTESVGGLTVDRVGRVVDMDVDDSSVCAELDVTAADSVKNHNSGCRTSPIGFSALAAEHSGNFGSSISGPAIDCTDPERTHELGLRTAARKNASMLEAKVNGLNMLVPMTEDVCSD